MSSKVTVQVGDVGKTFAAFRTRMFFDTFVNLDVFPEVRVLEEAFGAEVAAEGFLGFVDSLDVIVELTLPEKESCHATMVPLKVFFIPVCQSNEGARLA